MFDLESVQENIGYVFRDTAYIRCAMTHSSAVRGIGSGLDYERLEFLGDRVVNLVIADLLFKIFKHENEGMLAKRHTALVRGETLAAAAMAMNLGDYVVLSDAERAAGGSRNINILGDIMEAVTAAIYLDGGFNEAESFIERSLGDMLHKMTEPPRDPKTVLQEWSQSKDLGLPVYELTGQTGYDHAPLFTVQVSVQGYAPQTAVGSSKQKAEKAAAMAMITALDIQ